MKKYFSIKFLSQSIILSGLIFFLASCTLRGFQPPPSDVSEIYQDPQNRGKQFIRNAWKLCGGDVAGPGINSKYVDNVRATRFECMFNEELYLKGGDGGMCSDPDYRAKLPVCSIVPQRPRQRYYATPPIRSNLRCSNTDILSRGCIP